MPLAPPPPQLPSTTTAPITATANKAVMVFLARLTAQIPGMKRIMEKYVRGVVRAPVVCILVEILKVASCALVPFRLTVFGVN